MVAPAGRLKAVLFRRKVYVGQDHKVAIDLAFAGMSDLALIAISDKIATDKERLVFGYAYADGSDFIESDSQEARKVMYGFEPPY